MEKNINQTIQPIHLPIFEKLLTNFIKIFNNKPLNNTAIIYIHHPLQTSINVVDAIIRLGAKPENIYVLGKNYSECPSVVDKMISMGVYYQHCSQDTKIANYKETFTSDMKLLWDAFLSNVKDDVKEILILDHGGYAVTYMPKQLHSKYKIIGIEKTTAGLLLHNKHGFPLFPLIGVANCAAKRFLESPLIADAVVAKLMKLIPLCPDGITCGVVGYGAIGKAIAEKLLSMGFHVIVNDNSLDLSNVPNKKCIVTKDLSALFANSDYIFGCTGQDITLSMIEHFRLSSKNKTLISCSSEDKEFLSLLKVIASDKINKKFNKFDNLVYKTAFNANIALIRGGFPANFDNSGESVPANDIQLTRSLVLASILQAIVFFKSSSVRAPGLYALCPNMQSFLANEWLLYQPNGRYQDTIINFFNNKEWILKNSNGLYQHIELFDKIVLNSQIK